MSEVRFLHVADVHLDSPLQQLERYEGAPVDRIRFATRRAFENMVDRILEEKVPLVLIAGDLFDGEWKDMGSGLWLIKQLRRMQDGNTRVVLIRGNHDAKNVTTKELRWPENFIELSVTQAETKIFEDLGIAIHGRGFANRSATEDLAAKYPLAVSGLFNVGMLHTSLNGSGEHETYAPTSLEILRSRGYQYWALGHIHQRTITSLAPEMWVGYSGNLQGRHARELGPKGCYLVTATHKGIASQDFWRCDVLRWNEIRLDISQAVDLDALLDRFQSIVVDELADDGDRCQIVRVRLFGSGRMHQSLQTSSTREKLTAELRSVLQQFGENWLEKVRIETTSESSQPLDVAPELLEELGTAARLLQNDPAARAQLLSQFTPLWSKVALPLHGSGVHLSEPENELQSRYMEELIHRAQQSLIARLSNSAPPPENELGAT